MINADKPAILYIAVCTGCGATGTMNQIGGLTGQHGPTCPWHPHRVGGEPTVKLYDTRPDQ